MEEVRISVVLAVRAVLVASEVVPRLLVEVLAAHNLDPASFQSEDHLAVHPAASFQSEDHLAVHPASVEVRIYLAASFQGQLASDLEGQVESRL